MRTIYLLLLILLFLQIGFAQTNCSVNAGSDISICLGENSSFSLKGGVSGDFDVNTIEWRLESQPTGANVSIINPKSINTETTVLSIVGDYVFSLNVTCDLGDASQTVTYTVKDKLKSYLEFPELVCVPFDSIFEVRKVLFDDEYIQYDFLTVGILDLVSETEDAVFLTHRLNGCFDSDESELSYTVGNDAGCTIQKVGKLNTSFVYGARIAKPYFDDTGCVRLRALCLSEGAQLEWCIASQPSTSDAVLLNPNSEIAHVCDVIDSCYIFCLTVTGTECNDGTTQVVFCPDEDECGSEVILNRSFCNGTLPENLTLEGDVQGTPDETFSWSQIAGPPVTISNPNEANILIEGMESGNVYGFEFISFDPVTECLVKWTYYLKELTDVVTLSCRESEGSNCDIPSVGCYTRKEFFIDADNDTDVTISNVGITIRLLATPEEYNPEDLLVLNTLINGERENLSFGGAILVSTTGVPEVDFGKFADGFAMWLCGDLPTGNYLFRVRIAAECMFYEEDISLTFTRTCNGIKVNAGTDQVLPCDQFSTTLVGNALGCTTNDDEVGFWTTVEHPAGAENPIVNVVHDKFLTVEDLVPGFYKFQYAFPILSGTDLCKYDLSVDEATIWVTADEPTDLDPLPDLVYCFGDIIEIDLPIGGQNTAIEQTAGPSANIDYSLQDAKLTIDPSTDNAVYTFKYSITNDCFFYEDEFNIQILNATIDQATVLTADSCFFGIYQLTTIPLSAAPVSNGIGKWSYNGFGVAQFIPNEFANNVEVTFESSAYSEFIWTVSNDDCPNQNQDNVIVRAGTLLTGDINIDDIRDCFVTFPHTLELKGPNIPFASITWRLVSGSATTLPEIISPNKSTTDIVFYEPGAYSFAIEYEWDGDCSLNNASSSESKVVNVYLSRPGDIAFGGPDIVSCSLDNELSASTPSIGIGAWNIISIDPLDLMVDIEDENDPNSTITVDKAGIVNLEWSVSAEDPFCGTTSTDDVQLNVLNVAFVLNDIVLCNATNYTLNHVSTDEGDLSFSQESGPTTIGINTVNTTQSFISNLDVGEYIINYKYDTTVPGCAAEGQLVISNLSNPLEGLDLSRSFCTDEISTNSEISLDFIPAGYSVEYLIPFFIPDFAPAGIDAIINQDTTAFSYDGFEVDGAYIFRFSLTNGICDFIGDLSVNISEEPDLSSLQTDYKICEDGQLQLDAFLEGNFYYQWSPPDLVSDPNVFNPIYQGGVDTILNVLISNSPDFQSCVADLMVSISISDDLSLDLVDSIVTCFPQEIMIDSKLDAGFEISWSLDANFTTIIGTDPILIYQFEEQTIVYLSAKDQSDCEFFDEIIIVGDNPLVEINGDNIICDYDSPIVLEAIELNGNSITSFEWLNSNNQSISTNAILELEGMVAGAYTLQYFYSDNCVGAQEIIVTESALIDGISASSDPYNIYTGQSSQLSVDQNLDSDCTIIWDNASSLNANNISNPIATPEETTIYTATVTKDGCTYVDTTIVRVLGPCIVDENIFIPNLFTPNEDGENDELCIVGEFESFDMFVYNRWGEQIAHLNNQEPKWNGIYKDKLVTTDVYGYYIFINHCTGEQDQFKGNITVLK